MHRKFQDQDFVNVRYYSRNCTVLGIGVVVDYVSSKRKYLVRILGTDAYSTNYWRSSNTPHDKILNCHPHELTYIGESWYIPRLVDYASLMRQHASSLQHQMHNKVKEVLVKTPKAVRYYDHDLGKYALTIDDVDNYFYKDYSITNYDYTRGKGTFLTKHVVYLSYCVARLNQAKDDVNCLFRAYPETRTFERSHYVWN